MAAASWCSISLLLICGFHFAMGLNYLVEQRSILNTILHPDHYDVRLRPLDNPDSFSNTNVTVNMFVRMINKIDDVKMQYHVQLTFRQQWTDSRLKFDDFGGKIRYLQLFEMGKIWTPDLFFSNENSGFINNLMKPNLYFRIFPNGAVLHSARISVVLSCPMNLRNFPFDSQVCSMRMASYGYTTVDVVFLWKEILPVQIVKNLDIPHYTLMDYKTDYCNSKTNTGEYSCLRLDMTLKRNLNYYVIQVFIPCAMLVFISWISFWLDIHAPMTRLFITVGPLLVLAMIVSGINASLPPTSYAKSIDYYTGICLTFIFAALVEFAIVDYGWRSIAKKQRRATGTLDTTMEEENGTAFDMPLVNCQAETTPPNHAHSNNAGRIAGYYYRWLAKLPKGPKRLDVISRLVFPIVFVVFNIFYWASNLL